MTDTELFAKSVLLICEVVEAMGENDIRKLNGESPCYRNHSGLGHPIRHEIEEELNHRCEVRRQRAEDMKEFGKRG